METNKKRTSRKPTIYRTVGKPLNPSNEVIIRDSESDDDEESENEEPNQLVPYEDQNIPTKTKNRWAEKICFVCKLRLGPKQSLRIGGAFSNVVVYNNS